MKNVNELDKKFFIHPISLIRLQNEGKQIIEKREDIYLKMFLKVSF